MKLRSAACSCCFRTTWTTEWTGPMVLSNGSDRPRGISAPSCHTLQLRQAARGSCQAAQVIETRLSRYGTITSHLPAAPASVVACCAAHSQLLEACPAAASVLLLLLVTVAIIHARKRPRTAPGAPLWPRASSVLTTAAWGRCVALVGSVSRALKKQGAKHKQSPVPTGSQR